MKRWKYATYREDAAVTNKYTDHNELLSPLSIIMNTASIHRPHIRPDAAPARALTCPAEIKHLISFHCLRSVLPGSLPPPLLPPQPFAVLFSLFLARAPRVTISTHKSNVECQLPQSSLTHSAFCTFRLLNNNKIRERNPYVMSRKRGRSASAGGREGTFGWSEPSRHRGKVITLKPTIIPPTSGLGINFHNPSIVRLIVLSKYDKKYWISSWKC